MVTRVSDQVAGGPSVVFVQSKERISSAISPSPMMGEEMPGEALGEAALGEIGTMDGIS